MRDKTQHVLNHLLRYGDITSWDAIKLYRATRLSSIIYELRARGYEIITNLEYNPETGVNYARYVLIKNANN